MTGGHLTLHALAPDLVRVLFQPAAVANEPPAPPASWAVLPAEWPDFPIHLAETPAGLRLMTPELVAEVTRAPVRIHFYDRDGRPILRDDPARGIEWTDSQVTMYKEMPAGEHYYGFGQKLGFLDQRGRAMEQWATDDHTHTPDKDTLYQAIPFFLGLRDGRCYGVFVDCTARSRFDMGAAADQAYGVTVTGEALDYYFFAGPGPRQVLARYTELTGRMELPPRWALGNQQSRWSYYPAERVRQVAAEFRRRQIPCDVIYLDIDYMNGYRVFTWDQQRFPDPAGLLRALAEQGFKLVPIIDPGVKTDPNYAVFQEGIEQRHFVARTDGTVFTGLVWPGETAFPDFTRAATRRWWGDLHAGLLDQGVAGIWNDMNEPANFSDPPTIPETVLQGEDGRKVAHGRVHNAYGLLMCRAAHEGLLRLRPDRRPFLLTRSGYAGIQRYAAVWMGDNHSWWEHLLTAMPMCLGMGLSGVPFVGTDIGGFSGDATGELVARWTQLGAFMPLCRNHSAIGTRDQEPWAFGPEVEAVCRRYLRLRYRLLPFWYQLFAEAARTGLPIMRPLLLAYPDDPETYNLSDQFLLGSDLLVAPVYQPGATRRLVYLPRGVWYDYWTGQAHSGPCHIVAEAPLDVLPLYVRAGAILPLGPEQEYVGQDPGGELTLEVYAGADGALDLYEDDGETRAHTRGEWSETAIRVSVRDRLRIAVAPPSGAYRPPRQSLILRVRGVHPPAAATADGLPVPFTLDGDAVMVRLAAPGADGVALELHPS